MAADNRRYRFTGDIFLQTDLSKEKLKKGSKIEYSYGLSKSTNFQHVAILQSCKPLTPKQPYFEIEILKSENLQSHNLHWCSILDSHSNVAVGIAPPEINGHAGQYNSSVGYHSNNGRIYSSWKANANTLGIPFSRGHKIGVYVTYFGEQLSTVLFFYDHSPIATRYNFESSWDKFLPTITFSGGPADINVLWPNYVGVPPTAIDIPVSQWIRGPTATYDSFTNIFENPSLLDDLPIQSPEPLGNQFRGFIVTQEQVSSVDGKGASIGLATFSPLKPTPTCPLMKDYYTWLAKMKMKVGNSIGWGIYYEDDSMSDKAEQLCLVFVMFNHSIIDALFVLQPEGGFVPIVLLQPYASKVTISKKNVLNKDEIERLNKLYHQMLGPAMEILQNDRHNRELSIHSFRTSDQVILDANYRNCRILIPKTETPVHYVQLCKPLTPERRFFFIELDKINDHCQITVGIASANHRLNEAPGMDQDTVGYNSYTGQLFSNRKELGNTRGHRCRQGDIIGVEVQTFGHEMSVILFTKNFRPVGTRYLTLKNHQQFFPTVLIDSNTEPVELTAQWHNRVAVPSQYNLRNLEDWCVPEKTSVDLKEKLFILPEHFDHSLCIQAPSCLNQKNTHFEITLIDTFNDSDPPPAIAICTASPMDPTPASQFKQDYLRFWAMGDAAKYLTQGDKIGWGIIFPSTEDSENENEQDPLLLCYLTINRSVNYYRVLHQPIGGFYPVIIAPPNVNRIKIDFTTQVPTEDFTSDQIHSILADARAQIEAERFKTHDSDSADDDNGDVPVNELSFSNNVLSKIQPPPRSTAQPTDRRTVQPTERSTTIQPTQRPAVQREHRTLPSQEQKTEPQSAACTIQ